MMFLGLNKHDTTEFLEIRDRFLRLPDSYSWKHNENMSVYNIAKSMTVIIVLKQMSMHARGYQGSLEYTNTTCWEQLLLSVVAFVFLSLEVFRINPDLYKGLL